MIPELLARFVSSSGMALVSSLEEANIWSVAPPILPRGAAAEEARSKRQEAILARPTASCRRGNAGVVAPFPA